MQIPVSLIIHTPSRTVLRRLLRSGWDRQFRGILLTATATHTIAGTGAFSLTSPQVLRACLMFPGAPLSATISLRDAPVAQRVGLPRGAGRQVPPTDGNGETHRIGPSETHRGLGVSLDGEHLAVLTPRRVGPLREARRDHNDSSGDARFVSVDRPPENRPLPVVSQDLHGGWSWRTRRRKLVERPREVVLGSGGWNPDGEAAVFTARAGQPTGLGPIHSADRTFHSFADLGQDNPAEAPCTTAVGSAQRGRRLSAALGRSPRGLAGVLTETRTVVTARRDGAHAQRLVVSSHLTTLGTSPPACGPLGCRQEEAR